MSPQITSVQKSQEVSALLSLPDSHIIAGGTSFSRDPREGMFLVDITTIEGLDTISLKGTHIILGPLVTLETLADSPLIKKFAPSLAESAAAAAPEDIRIRGTLGGNLADKRIGDCSTALLAAGAKLTIKTDCDYRELMLDRFWAPDGSNTLAYDEWITRISIPVSKAPREGEAFGRIGTWDDVSTPAAAAVRISLDENDVVTGIRGALRTGSSKIIRMFPAERILKNKTISDHLIREAVNAMDASPALSELLHGILQRSTAMARERGSI